jgi:flagellar hook-basal body complex protein FliE
MPIRPVQMDAKFLESAMPAGHAQPLDSGRIKPPATPATDAATTQSDGLQSGGSTFGKLLHGALQDVNTLQVEANRQAELLATGDAQNPHDAVIAMEKADLALQLTIRVTEKALSAYQQVSQMQI